MADYTYPGILVADAATFRRATNAACTVYDVNDLASAAPLTLKDPNGLPLPNPVTSSSDGFLPPLNAPAEGLKIVGGGLTVIVYSHAGMQAAAAASAADAAEAAQAAVEAKDEAAAGAASALAGAVTSAQNAATAAASAAALVGAPADSAIAAAINGSGTATKAALSATILEQIEAEVPGIIAAPIEASAANLRKSIDRPAGLLLNLPPVADRSASFGTNTLSNGTDTYHYSRTYHPVMVTANDIRLVYSNFAYGQPGVSNITVSAAVEPEVNGFTAASAVTSLIPVMFNGQPSTVIAPGGFAVSDPIPVSRTKGKAFYVRTSVNAAAGGKWPLGLISNPTASEEEGLANGTVAVPGYLATTNPTALPKPGGRVYSPVAIIGAPATVDGVAVRPKWFLGVGDSIMDGLGGSVDNKGFFRNANRKAGYPYIDLGTPSQTAQGFVAPFWPRGPLLSSPTTAVICEYGSNDCAVDGITLGTIQISMIAAWRAVATRGHRVIQTTITPRTTSTDFWRTTGNQTPIAPYTTLRNQLNAWIRAGAPLTAAYGPAAIGSGTYVTGQAGHPLSGYFELADIVESARDSGIWKAPQGRSLTVTAYQNGFSVDSPGAYTSADIGETLYIAGAGPAGADLLVEVTNVPNSGRVSVQGITSTAQASAAAVFGHMTPDGIHPSSTANRMIGDALSTYLQAL